MKLVVGPGTGLGVAALVPTGDGLHVIASEAGHISFGPAYADEEIVFHRLAQTALRFRLSMCCPAPGLPRCTPRCIPTC